MLEKVNNFLIFRFIWFCSSSFFVPFKKLEKEITKNSVNMIRPGLRSFCTQENIKDLSHYAVLHTAKKKTRVAIKILRNSKESPTNPQIATEKHL